MGRGSYLRFYSSLVSRRHPRHPRSPSLRRRFRSSAPSLIPARLRPCDPVLVVSGRSREEQRSPVAIWCLSHDAMSGEHSRGSPSSAWHTIGIWHIEYATHSNSKRGGRVRKTISLVHINDFQAKRGSIEDENAHHRFIIKDNTFAGPQGRGRASQVAEDDERLSAHFGALEGDDVDYPAIGCEEGVELVAEFLFADLVVEVVDVEGLVWLGGHDSGSGCRTSLA